KKMHVRASLRRGLGSTFIASAAAVAGMMLAAGAHRANATVLLNDTWADGTRTNTNLPTDSADYAGLTAGPPAATLTAAPGKLAAVPGTSSYKLWTYFTSDLSAPDGNQPHNSVT